MRERERLFSNFFGKQPIENKSYFYKSFLLVKDSLLWEKLNQRKKILFPESEEYNKGMFGTLNVDYIRNSNIYY